MKAEKWRSKLQPVYRLATRLPPIVRSAVGVVLVLAGIAGIILPLLGFWLVPLGLMFVALDVPPWRDRVEAWLGLQPQ
jgi:hypothetical protein